MKELREELARNPPVIGAYTPRRGELCAARFSADKQWYRARIEGVRGKSVEILYVDFGNVSLSHCSGAFGVDRSLRRKISIIIFFV